MAASRKLALHLQRHLYQRPFVRPFISTERRAISKLLVSRLSSEAYATDDGGLSSAAAAPREHLADAAADSTA